MKLFTSILLTIALSTSISFADQKQILYPEGKIQDFVNTELKEGRWELVMFWATYCPICKKDFVKIAQFIKDNPSIPLTIVGVVVDGTDEQEKAESIINKRELNYTHLITDYDNANDFYETIAESELIGVPSYLLYNTKNEMVGFNDSAIDIDALEIFVYE